MITEKLLFACHMGTVGRRKAGILIEGHCLPVACSHDSQAAPDGICALVECADAHAVFDYLALSPGIEAGVDGGRPSGLLVYEVGYDETAVPEHEDVDSPEAWEHLTGGAVRRPTPEELAPLSRDGGCPWPGGRVF